MEEQKSILQMLKDGIITVSEADDLLNTIRGEKGSKFCPRQKQEALPRAKKKTQEVIRRFDEGFSGIIPRAKGLFRNSLKAVEREISKAMEKEENDGE